MSPPTASTRAEQGALPEGGRRRWRDLFLDTHHTGGTLSNLDGLRAVAVIIIFLRHSWGLSGSAHPRISLFDVQIDAAPLVVMMSNGVDLFFVLSGFLLARRFIVADLRGEPRPDLRRYFRSRVFRIVPAYWFVLAAFLVFFVPSVLPAALVYSSIGLKTVLAHVFFLQTALPWSYGVWYPESPFWTLTIEVLFYAAVPWWSRLFFRDRWRWALPLTLIGTLGWLWLVRSSVGVDLSTRLAPHIDRADASPEFIRFFLSKQLPAHAFDFACGMTVANWYARRLEGGRPARLWRAVGTRLWSLAGVAWIVAAMAALGTLSLRHTYFDGLTLMASNARSALAYYYGEEVLCAIGFAAVLAACLARPRAWSPFSWSGVRIVGVIGYSVYLWHMPILYSQTHLPWLVALPPAWRWVVMCAFGGAIVAALSIGTYLVVERPFIDRGHRPPKSRDRSRDGDERTPRIVGRRRRSDLGDLVPDRERVAREPVGAPLPVAFADVEQVHRRD